MHPTAYPCAAASRGPNTDFNIISPLLLAEKKLFQISKYKICYAEG